MYLTRAEMRKKAYEIAAGFIESMDLDKFWSDEIAADNIDHALSEFQRAVVQELYRKAESFK